MVAAALLLVIAQAPSAWSAAVYTEAARESFKFRFENPSSFDTPELVPHFFEITTDNGNLWLGATIGHPVGRQAGTFRIALTPQGTRRADDFDTFFQPDGNVVVTGTTGNASIRGWRVSERIALGHVGPLAVAIEYSYRRHRARFHDGDGITTTTQPPSVTHRLVTTRETTTSELHALAWIASWTRAARGGHVEISGSLAPISVARLTVDLPDKYPGRLLVFYAKPAVFDGGVAYAIEGRRWVARFRLDGSHTCNWQSAFRLRARRAAVSAEVTLR